MYLPNVGHIRKPTLRQIYDESSGGIGDVAYQFYLSLLAMTPAKFFERADAYEEYDALSSEEKANIYVFDLITANESMRGAIADALTFFMVEDVEWDEAKNAFLVYDQETLVGMIVNQNWHDVVDIIMQTNHIEDAVDDDLSSIKNAKARKIAEKLQRGRRKMKQANGENADNEIGNAISVIASFTQYRYVDVWDLTIYQLWDIFTRFNIGEQYAYLRTNAAVWGNEHKQFDLNERIKNITVRSS